MRNYEADLLSLEDILDMLREKGYDYDEILEMVDTGIDEVFEDEFVLDIEYDDDEEDY